MLSCGNTQKAVSEQESLGIGALDHSQTRYPFRSFSQSWAGIDFLARILVFPPPLVAVDCKVNSEP